MDPFPGYGAPRAQEEPTLVVLALACVPPGTSPASPEAPCDADPTGLVCPLMGSGIRGAGEDGLDALSTNLFLPTALAFDPTGHPVVVDFNNMRLRRLGDDGVLTAIAGTGEHSYAGEGVPALESALENPIDAVIGPDGTIYIAELHGCRILEVDPDGLLTTFAGSAYAPGYEAYGGDGGPATEAQLSQATGLALGDDGTVYVADTNNHVIRAIDPSGTIRTLAGAPEPGFVDGTGADARFDQPWSLAFADGALWVADKHNDAVRRVDVATGEVVTVAGTGEPGSAGDGGPATSAQLSGPLGVAVGPDDAIYVADSDNHAIRRVDLEDGTIATVLGELGTSGEEEDGVELADALLDWPNDVAFDDAGDLLVVDTLHDRVRRVVGFAP